jgi:hypothetical protein
MASTTWYVNGLSGNNSDKCRAAQTACRTLGHAISLAASGDSIMVAAAIYVQNLNTSRALKVVGSGANATIIYANDPSLPVVHVTTHALLSKLTISQGNNSGVFNSGTLTLNHCIVTQNIGQRHNGISYGIDAGNPNGCTDGHGSLLKTDQRGQPRPDPEGSGGCDIGAFERQSD